MPDFNTMRAASASSRATQIDAGLRTHMNKVYGLMSLAMLVTGAVAFGVGSNPQLVAAIFGTPLKWVVMLAPLAVVFAFSAMINRMQTSTAQIVFFAYSALMGLSLSYIFLAYTGVSIAQTFLVTAIAFAGLSLYGYTTKRDLSAFGSFLMMGLIGLVVASLLNIFIQSSAMQFAISAIGVLLFAGLTAYDTQNIKNTYLQLASTDRDFLGKAAILGALQLYLDFLNLFMFLLQFLGDRRN